MGCCAEDGCASGGAEAAADGPPAEAGCMSRFSQEEATAVKRQCGICGRALDPEVHFINLLTCPVCTV